MSNKLILVLVVGLVVMTTAIGQTFPSYYPEEGFQRTGTVNAVYYDESRIVIDDVPYHMSDAPVVHSLTAYSVSIARLRPGVKVAFKTGNSRLINEFWLLPMNYDPRQRR